LNLSQITAEYFNPFIGQIFNVQRKGIKVAELKLEQVYISPVSNKNFRQQFSLYLKSSGLTAFPDGLFTLSHPECGDLHQIYINRMLPDQAGDQTPYYQISFN
jgi:hypothetical protein